MFPNHPPTFSRFFAVFFVFCFFCTLLPLPVSVLLQLFAFFCSFEICMQLSAVHLGEMIAREIFCAVLCSRCSRVSIWKELEFSMSSAAKSVLFKINLLCLWVNSTHNAAAPANTVGQHSGANWPQPTYHFARFDPRGSSGLKPTQAYFLQNQTMHDIQRCKILVGAVASPLCPSRRCVASRLEPFLDAERDICDICGGVCRWGGASPPVYITL